MDTRVVPFGPTAIMEPTTSASAVTAPHTPLETLAVSLLERRTLTDALAHAIDRGDVAQAAELAPCWSAQAAQLASRWGAVSTSGGVAPGVVALLRELAAEAGQRDAALQATLASQGFARVDEWLAARSFDAAAVARSLTGLEDFALDRDVVLLCGPRAGDALDALIGAGATRVLWLDPGDVIPPTREGVTVLTATELTELEQRTWQLPVPPPHAVRAVESPGYDRERADAAGRRIVEVLRLRVLFQDFARRYGVDLSLRAVRNAPRVAAVPSASRLDGVLKGVPAVIVAAGPSLEKNLAQLKELQGRVAVLGMNQTLKAMRRAGVKPDVVLAGDWGNLVPHFEGVARDEIGALGLATVVTPELFDVPAGAHFTFAASPWIEHWLFDAMGEDATVLSRGSVSFALFELALRMGCDPIVFVGLDLALDGDKYYAESVADGAGRMERYDDGTVSMRGMSDVKMKLAASGQEQDLRDILEARVRTAEIPGWHGGTVQTTPDLHVQLVGLKEHLREARGRARVINATEGGAFIEGMEHMPLREALAAVAEAPAREPDALRRTVQDALGAAGPERREKLLKALRDTRTALPRIAEIAEVCDKLLARHGDRARNRAEYQRARSRWVQHRTAIDHLVSLDASFVSQDATLRRDATMRTLLEAERKVYRAVKGSAKRFIEGIDRALDEAERKARPQLRLVQGGR